jgi:asparagine synthase (glutamine-hydrolysing)
MAHSREVRLPFLNHELVEFLFSLPAEYKIHNGWTKYLMRKSFENTLPKEIAWRKDKIGYEPPQKEWMSRPEILERVVEARKVLVDKNILDKSILQKTPDPSGANQTGDKSWEHIMVSKLF